MVEIKSIKLEFCHYYRNQLPIGLSLGNISMAIDLGKSDRALKSLDRIQVLFDEILPPDDFVKSIALVPNKKEKIIINELQARFEKLKNALPDFYKKTKIFISQKNLSGNKNTKLQLQEFFKLSDGFNSFHLFDQ